jgi:hypothetical protein
MEIACVRCVHITCVLKRSCEPFPIVDKKIHAMALFYILEIKAKALEP